MNRSIPSTAKSAAAPLRSFFEAVRAWWQAFGYMNRQGLRHYHFSGAAILGLITWAGFGLSGWLTERLRAFMGGFLNALGFDADSPEAPSDTWWSEALLWASSALEWMLEWGGILLVLWLKVKLTKYLLLTLMAPFMSAIAGAVRERETGNAMPFSLGQMMRDLIRGIRTAAILLAVEIALTLMLYLTGLVLAIFTGPLAILLSPLVLILGWMVGAYFYGAAVFDAVYEQAGLNWRNSLRTGWKDRYRLLGIGAVFSMLLAIPGIGVFLATFMGPMPCTVAAARLTFSTRP